MRNILRYFILVFLFFISSCVKIPRRSLITVIGIDKTGSFFQRDEKNRKELISKIVYQIIKEKAEFQKNDKLWGLKKWLGGIKEEKFEKVIIAPISFRGPGGIENFLIFNDDPVSISEDRNFSQKGLKGLIFPLNERPSAYTDFLQFFREINTVIVDTTSVKVHYILITDGLPDPTGREGVMTQELTSRQIIDNYGERYIEELNKILVENVKISFIGVDSHILEFWNYIAMNINQNRKIKIESITARINDGTVKKVARISNPYYW